MATGQYIGINGVARKVTAPYIGVNGVARNVKSGYVGVNGVARLFFAPESGKVVLEVKKVTSDTYANETQYTAEEFILLNIYPKPGGTVNVTYGGLTKTITDTSGAEEPNAQQVFFGTFNGVSDSVATPASGMLTIDGDYYAFGQTGWKTNSKSIVAMAPQPCITEINSLGKITYIPAYAFSGCTGLTSVTIPASVTTIYGSAFSGCTGLTSVTIPARVTTITSGAFSGCTGLTSVTIPASVTKIYDGVFSGCTGLTNIVVASGNDYYSSEDGALFNKNKTDLLAYPSVSGHYTIPASITTIGSYAFSGCTGLTSVTIPSSVTTIGIYAFNRCTGLTSVTFANRTGWYWTSNSDYTGGNSFSFSESDTAQNAVWLTNDYASYYWYRT